MIDTLGGMRASIQRWLRGERVNNEDIDEAVNDAADSLWKSLMPFALSIFMGGPVTIDIDADTQRATVISVADPTEAPVVGNVVSGNLAEHQVYAQRTLVTASGTETLPSPLSTVATIPANNVAVVPTAAFADGAIGWNCYAASPSSTRLCKQNDAPIPFGTSFQEPETGFLNNPDGPYPPTENTTGDNIFYIRHLEPQTPQGTFLTWNGGDIDSLMMRRAAASIAATSDYQRYAWDLINQRTIEIRPTSAMALAPRYFYIQKTRTMRFDSSPLPFPTIPSTEFIRNYALSNLFLSLHEYQAAQGWEAKAERDRLRCQKAIAQTNQSKNQFVTPYLP